MIDETAHVGPKVVCLVSDPLLAFEFGIAYEVFGLPRQEVGPGWYTFDVCGLQPGRIGVSGGLDVWVESGLEALLTADLIIVPGWGDVSGSVPAAFSSALQEAHLRGARIVSFCSGVVVLAEAGLLDNRRATTHWRFVEKIANRFPKTKFESDVLYVDEGSVMTAAGSAAAIDLCLHIVRKDFGLMQANMVARGLVTPPHREGGHAQHVRQPVPAGYEAPRIGAVIERVRTCLSQEISVTRLADQAGMSLRTFQRRFEAITGLSPSAWIMNERLRLACELLESKPDLTLDAVASECGFGSVHTMRHHFRQKLQTSPGKYRRTFAPSTLTFPTPRATAEGSRFCPVVSPADEAYGGGATRAANG